MSEIHVSIIAFFVTTYDKYKLYTEVKIAMALSLINVMATVLRPIQQRHGRS